MFGVAAQDLGVLARRLTQTPGPLQRRALLTDGLKDPWVGSARFHRHPQFQDRKERAWV